MERTPEWVWIVLVASGAVVVALWLAGHANGQAEVHHAGSVTVLEAKDPGNTISPLGGPGTIAVLDGGCLGLRVGSEDRLILWPSGTTVSGEGDDVVITVDDHEFAVGDEVGPYGIVRQAETLDDVKEFRSLLDDVPAACRDRPVQAIGTFR